MFMKWKRMRLPVGILLAGAMLLGTKTTVQAPRVESDAVIVGASEHAVQGVEQKGYVATPEGENWEEVAVILSDPEGNEKVVDAELDDNSGHFLFETDTDKTGTWSVDALQIVENGQTVVQEVADTAIEVYDTVDEAYDAPGAQILAESLKGITFFSAEDYRRALAQISAIDAEGNYIPMEVSVRGAITQDYTFFNDGQERTASEPIDTVGNGMLSVQLAAEGAESERYEFHIDGDKRIVQAKYTSLPTPGYDTSLPNPFFAAKTVSTGDDSDIPSESIIARLGGSNRYETAAHISSTAFSKTNYAILVNHSAFPDALASSSLTRAYNAPILFTNTGSLPEPTQSELQRLGVKNLFLIGGENVITPALERELARNYRIQRLWGERAADTARAIATFLQSTHNADTALLANISAPQDGLVAGAYASRNYAPVFYTDRDTLSPDTLQALRNYRRIIVVGGVNVVSTHVEKQLRNAGIRVERAAGDDRYETAALFARKYFPESNRAIVASGLDANMVDALTGSALGGVKNAPVLLSSKEKLPQPTIDYYNSKDSYISYLLGGPNAVTNDVLNELRIWTATPPPTLIDEPDDGPPRIMLDPGHGWNYNQGVNPQYYEGNQMLYFSYYLREELENYGFKVGITRMPDGVYPNAYQALLAEKDYANKNRYQSINNQIVSLAERGRLAQDYDLLLSLHSNAPFDIAASELFDSTANPNRNLAEKLIKTVSDTFGHTNRGVKYRYDDKGDNWYGVLRNSKAEHAMLLEHGFHTGRSDVEKLLDFNFLKKLAAAEARTLAEYYGLR